MKKKTARKATSKKKKASPAGKSVIKKKALPKKTARAARVLSPGEPPPFHLENRRGEGAGVVICDHASSRIPRALKDMGLKKATLRQHIGWDIGAEEASLHIGHVLDMPVVLARYSRLVVDLNRAPHHLECMPESSDHIKIPGNAALSKKDRERRLKEVYWPYHKKLAKVVDGLAGRGGVPLLLAIHSFTPQMDGFKRPWHIAVLWRREEKIAKQLVRALRNNHPDLLVGENQPYTLFGDRFAGSTIWRHGEERNLPYVFVEFRQDLVDTKQKAIQMADILLQALQPILENPETYAGRKVKPGNK